MRMVSSKKFVATQNTSISGGPIVGDIYVVLVKPSLSFRVILALPVQQRPASE
jgi:hypothetical protein